MTKVKVLKFRPPKIIIYGDAGTGKTATLATLGPLVQIINLDEGMRTAVSMKDRWRPVRLECEVKNCFETEFDKATAFTRAKSYIVSAAEACRKNKFEYKCLGVDSWTTLAEAAVRQVLAGANMLGKNPQIQHWGMAFTLLEDLLATLRSLPIAVVVLAHVQRFREQDGQDTITKKIATPGQKLPHKVPNFFDEVWVSKVVGGKYKLFSKATTNPDAKSRGCLGDVEQEIGMVKMFRGIGYDIDEENIVEKLLATGKDSTVKTDGDQSAPSK